MTGGGGTHTTATSATAKKSGTGASSGPAGTTTDSSSILVSYPGPERKNADIVYDEKSFGHKLVVSTVGGDEDNDVKNDPITGRPPLEPQQHSHATQEFRNLHRTLHAIKNFGGVVKFLEEGVDRLSTKHWTNAFKLAVEIVRITRSADLPNNSDVHFRWYFFAPYC